jgi:hypothetical protein
MIGTKLAQPNMMALIWKARLEKVYKSLARVSNCLLTSGKSSFKERKRRKESEHAVTTE